MNRIISGGFGKEGRAIKIVSDYLELTVELLPDPFTPQGTKGLRAWLARELWDIPFMKVVILGLGRFVWCF